MSHCNSPVTAPWGILCSLVVDATGAPPLPPEPPPLVDATAAPPISPEPPPLVDATGAPTPPPAPRIWKQRQIHGFRKGLRWYVLSIWSL